MHRIKDLEFNLKSVNDMLNQRVITTSLFGIYMGACQHPCQQDVIAKRNNI